MEVVGHECIAEYVAVGHDVFSYFFKEEFVVAVAEEDAFFVVSAVVDVVDVSFDEIHTKNFTIQACHAFRRGTLIKVRRDGKLNLRK